MKATNTDTKTSIGNWLAGRVEHRIDRLWFGGVVLTNVAVWQTLGAIYIGLFLVGYFFVFALCLRGHLESLHWRF